MTEHTNYFDITMSSTEKTESGPFIELLQHPDVSGFLYVVLEVSIIGFIGFILYYFKSKEKSKNDSDPERPVLLEGSPEEESAEGRVDGGRTEKGMFSSSTPQFLISNYSCDEEIEHSTPYNSNINTSLLITPYFRRADLLSPDAFISAGSHISTSSQSHIQTSSESHIQTSSSREALQSSRSPAYALCQEMSTPDCGRSCQLSPDAFMSAASHIQSTQSPGVSQSEKLPTSSPNQGAVVSVRSPIITTYQDVSLSERDPIPSGTSSPYVSVLSQPADVSNPFSDM